MKIIGLSNFARYESSFAMVTDEGKGSDLRYILLDEERLLRVKHTYGFPLLAMESCLDAFGVKDLSEIDLLVTDYSRRPSLYNDGPGYRKLEHDYLKALLKIPRERTLIVNHHLAHAAGVYYPSQFDEAAILIVDGMGSDLETQSLFHAKGGKIELVEKGHCWGPGGLYSEITTEVLGFTGLNGVDLAGKTMGLAPFGRDVKKKILDIRAKYDGLNSDYSYFMSRFPKPFIKQKGLRKCRNPEDVTSDYFSRVAYEVQEEAEKAMIHFANYAYERTGARNLCVSGGVGLNSVANGKLLGNTPFEKIYITPACSDTGITLGLALYGYYQHAKPSSPKRFFMPTAYTGKSYPADGIRGLLDKLAIRYEPRDIKKVASEIAKQNIIGWFIGGSEVGPRALGHRSIIVDPRRPQMKDIVNLRVKHREWFRPFAPAILEENVSEYFPIKHKSPFMIEVYPVKPEMRTRIPSTVHVDGTGRLQTVSEKESPEYYALIKAFYDQTGVPVVLNTSFNDKEPIVETPRDALITFLRTEIDMLVLEDVVIRKEHFTPARAAQLAKRLETERAEDIAEGLKRTKAKFFHGYTEEGCKAFLDREEKLAEWRLKYKAKYDLECFLDAQKARPARVLIYGTRKHTKALYERIYDFPSLRVTGFIPYAVHAHEDTAFDAYPVAAEKTLASGSYDYVLVSSHEYQYRILERLDHYEVPAAKRVVLYDNAADSLVRHLEYLPVYNPVPRKAAKKAVSRV